MSERDDLGQTLPPSRPAAPSAPGAPTSPSERYALPEGTTDPELGRGGMGRVLKLVDTHLQREVAMKELLGGADAMMAQLFVREARALALLEHPGVVPVYELGQREDGTPFYVMRRIHGRALSAVLAQCVSLDERLSLLPHLIDVAHTVGYAHNKRVVHRDLKPDNVMVGKFGETLVIDWGLALVNGEAAPGAEVAGTPAYMSPEQAGATVVDARSDVWSLGVMLFELLTGRRPFDASDASQTMEAVRTAPIPSVRSLEPAAPRGLAAVVDRALQRVPSLRFENGEAMAAALEAAQRERAPKPTVLKLAVAALAVVCAGLLFVAGDAGRRVDDAHRDARLAVSDARRESAEVQSYAALSALRARDTTTAKRLAEKVADTPLGRGVLLRVAEVGVPEQRWSVTVPAGCASLAVLDDAVACATLNGVTVFGVDGKERRQLSTGPLGWQHAVVALPDGQLASAGDDGVLRVWSLAEDKPVRRAESLGAVRALAVAGVDLIVGLAAGHVRRVSPTGEVTDVTKHPRPVWWLAATPGQVASVSEGLLRITGEVPAELDRHVGAVTALNDLEFAVGVERSVAVLHGGEVKTLGTAHRDDVTALTWSQGRLVSGSSDGTVRWWFPDGVSEGVLTGFSPGVQALGGDARTLYVATTNRKLEAWTLPARRAGSDETGVPSAWAWWPGGGLVTGYRDGRLVRVDAETHEAHVLEARHVGPVRAVARVFGDEASGAIRFLSAGDDGRVLAQRWNGSVDTLDALDGARVLAVAASPDAKHAAWLGDDGTRVLWSLEFGKEVSRSRDTRAQVLAFSPDSRWLALGRDDKHVTVIDAMSGAESTTLGPLDGAISALTWTHDGSGLLTGTTDGAVTLWRVKDARATRTWKQSLFRVGALAANEKYVAAGCDDGSVWLFAPGEGDAYAQVPTDSGSLMLVTFTPEGLVVAGRDRVVHVFPRGDTW